MQTFMPRARLGGRGPRAQGAQLLMVRLRALWAWVLLRDWGPWALPQGGGLCGGALASRLSLPPALGCSDAHLGRLPGP